MEKASIGDLILFKGFIKAKVVELRTNSVIADVSIMEDAKDLGIENNLTVVNHKNYQIISKSDEYIPSYPKYLNVDWRNNRLA